MMKPTSKIISQGSETGEDKSGTPSRVSSVRLPSPNARRRTLTAVKRSASLSRNASKQMLQPFDDQLSISASMKSVAIVKEEHTTPLPRNVMIKNLRLMAKKRRDLTQMRKSLIQQQNTYLDLYAQLRDLEAKSGIDAGDSVGEVRVLAVTGWPAYDLLLLVRNDLNFIGHTDVNGVLGPSILKELNSQLSTIPEEVLSMGADLMARRLEVLEYLRSRCRSERNDWKSKNTEFDAVSENSHKLVVDTAKNLEAKVVHSQQMAKTAWIDRDILLKKIERLQKELTICQNKIETTLPAPEEKHEPGDQNKNDHNATTDPSSNTKLVEELNKERAARECLKQVVSSAEGMLRAARARIAALERQLRDARAELENTIKKHKEYEQLHRHRETSYDVRSKKLLQVSKTGEVTIEILSRQRDALELRVKELLDQTKSVEHSYEAQQSEQKSRLESLQAKLFEQEKHRNTAEKRIQEQEERLKNMQEEYNKLRERSERLVQTDKERCLDILPRKENEPSEKETEIWKDLQATKMKLERVTEELRQSRADKESLLQSLSRIAQEGSENNMANELLIREQNIFKLQQDIEQQKQAIKSLQESTVQKDNQICALKMEVGRLRSYDCYSNKENPKQDLALEVLDLSAKVATLKRERESLVSEAASRALMLERHERSAELFAHVTRTRRELAAHLEGRSENQLVQDGFVKVTPSVRNSLSSACLKAAETWSELRSDRERVLRLQNIVISQNLQLERESRIRTQLEHRRAILERIFFSHVNSNQHNSLEHQLPYSFENEES